MRRYWLTIALCVLAWTGVQAQTMNIVVGEVTYRIPAAEAGNMTYTDGTSLTVLGKTFSLSEVDRMYVDDTSVTPGSVSVVYNGSSAAVSVAGNCMQHLSVTASGATVSILQADGLTEEVTYTLSGSSTNGSFYLDGNLKATVVLSDLSLTCTTTAPVNIQNGKRINLELVGTTTLKDAATSNGKGALMVNGHSEIYGSGVLNLYGYAKHAYWADEYIQLKKSLTGTVNILYAAKDGINVNQYFEQNGGTLRISGVLDDGLQVGADDEYSGYANIQGGTLEITCTAAGTKCLKTDGSVTIGNAKSTPVITLTNSGTGLWDSTDKEVKGAACISSDASITLDTCTLTCTATGNGGKGIKCDSVFTMNAGTVSVSTSGKRYVYYNGTVYDGTYSGGGGGGGWGGQSSLADSCKTSPKGIRVGIKASWKTGNQPVGALVINGGSLTVSVSGAQDGSEGVECKNTITINGGTVDVYAYDDAVNSAKDMNINGGTVSVVSANNDGLDSNYDLFVNGGTVIACGAKSPECCFDALEGRNFYFNGGYILGIGGSSVTPGSGSSQCYVSTSGSATAGSTITLKNSGSTTTYATFTVPAKYTSTSSGGGGRPGWGGSSGSNIIVSCPDIVSGTSYKLTVGTSTSSVTGKTGSSSGGWW